MWESAVEHYRFCVKYFSNEWNTMTAAEYQYVLLGIGFIGMMLLRSTLKR